MGNDVGKMVEMLMAMLGSNDSEDTEEDIKEINDANEVSIEEPDEIPEESFLAEKSDDGLQSLLGGLSGGNDKRVSLLSSIKPYMKGKRQEKVDAAISLVKLISVSSSLGFNFFEKR